jgi:TonB-dependent receptor
MQKSILNIGFFLLAIYAFGQGSITGVVKDAHTGETIVGANVVIQGTIIGSSTDIDGNFLIPNINEGTYTLQVSYVAYKTHLIPDVKVETAKRVSLDIVLTEDISELAEVMVTAKSHTDADYDLLKSIKLTKVVVSGISAEQISKSLDRDAAQVVRRIPGVTVKGDQFIVIRGLSERYNAVMLNNAYAPSVETDIRSFSFAAIPSSQLDKILVFKSPSPDMPGDFGGGVVKVFTKSIPDANSVVMDYSTQVRAGTTFQDFYQQQRNPGHFTGFNTGYYDLPSTFPADLNSVQQSEARMKAGRSLKNLWTPQKSTAIPDQRFTITLNRNFNFGKIEVGSITAVNYSNAYTTFKVDRGDYTESGGKIDQNFGYSDRQYNQQIRTGFLSNWAFRFNNNHTIEFKNLYNQSSFDQYVNRTGTGISTGQLNGSFDKVYRGIYSGQLNGSHDLFGKRTMVEWMAAYNNSYRDQPDYKRYRSNFDSDAGQASVIIPNTADPNLLGRFYSELNESAYSGGLSIRQQFNFNGNALRNPELKAGLFFENKERTFKARNIGYQLAGTYLNPDLMYAPVGVLFQPENINNTDGIEVGEITYQKNSYGAANNLFAYYFMTSIPIGDRLKVDGGLRMENNLQQLHSYDDFAGISVDPKYQVNRLLPSANISYNFTEKTLVRAAYGQSLNRPEFRELAPFSFYDFNFNFVNIGNPNLQTARIDNVDLRFETYPGKNEMITFGAFYKNFVNPIELIIDINSPGGGVKNVNYANAQSAQSYGLEVEVKKSLYGLTGISFVNNISVLFNASLIKSKIKIPDGLSAGQDNNRPLQGQAPYVVNAALFYNHDESGWQVNLLYNVVGKNIAFVGNENYHTVYQMPRNVIDLTFSKNLSERIQLKGGISDILNQSFLLLQDGNDNGKLERNKDQVIQQYKPGQVFSIGFSVKLKA